LSVVKKKEQQTAEHEAADQEAAERDFEIIASCYLESEQA
jgi:hypothetical protein